MISDKSDREFDACLRAFAHLRSREEAEREARRSLAWCSENGARVLYPGHEDYPFDNSLLEQPPPFLTVWGEAPWKIEPALAIVGSREPSHAALDWMSAHLSDFLRKVPAVIVSGGARGIDQMAHRLAIRSGRPTVVFLPSGLARPYPAEWRSWKDEVLRGGGAIISHYPPFQEIRRRHFEERNLLIAALARALFVVEARRRSGSSMTGRLARDLGRKVAVLPAHPAEARAGGTIDLLIDGATPIRDAGDLLTFFNLETPDRGLVVKRLEHADLTGDDKVV